MPQKMKCGLDGVWTGWAGWGRKEDADGTVAPRARSATAGGTVGRKVFPGGAQTAGGVFDAGRGGPGGLCRQGRKSATTAAQLPDRQSGPDAAAPFADGAGGGAG